MKKSSSELKILAKQQLTGHYGILIAAALLVTGGTIVINMILSSIFNQRTPGGVLLYSLCTLIVSLLTTLFAVGIDRMALSLARDQETSLSDLLYVFSHQPDRVIVLTILIELICLACVVPGVLLTVFGTALGSIAISAIAIILTLAGIVLAFSRYLAFSQVFFLYLDDPEKGSFQLLKESRELMAGNKGRYFYLYLSFIGLALLSVLTCGLGMLWIAPYMTMTMALFYQDLIDAPVKQEPFDFGDSCYQ